MASSTQESTARAIFYAFMANFGIAIAKTWAAWVTGSGSMLAEAIHSYADTGNQVLLFVGLKQSQRPADDEHPLGYGKMSYFWSFIVAVLLFSMGGLFSIYEGLHKLQNPEPISQIWIAIVVLILAIRTCAAVSFVRRILERLGSEMLIAGSAEVASCGVRSGCDEVHGGA